MRRFKSAPSHHVTLSPCNVSYGFRSDRCEAGRKVAAWRIHTGEKLPYQIPRGYADAFRDVVFEFTNWSPSIPEFTFRIERQSYSMSAVCNLVSIYKDKLPAEVFEELSSRIHLQQTDLRGELAKDPTYATGAKCLRRLISDRKNEAARQG